jgi:G:T-mismatch repair DNA endonuclease (very short patch repair protein)
LPEYECVVEYNGTYWHTDPRYYREDYFNAKKKSTAKEIWAYDETRKSHALNNFASSYVVLWEADLKNRSDEEIKGVLLEAIKNRENF